LGGGSHWNPLFGVWGKTMAELRGWNSLTPKGKSGGKGPSHRGQVQNLSKRRKWAINDQKWVSDSTHELT